MRIKLHWLALFACITLFIVNCGGSGPNVGSSGDETADTRTQTNQLLNAKLATLTLTPENAATEIPIIDSFMKGLGTFKSVVAEPDNGIVSGTYPSGQTIIVLLNRNAAATMQSATNQVQAVPPNGFPPNGRAVPMFTFVTNQYLNTTPSIKSALLSSGYKIPVDSKHQPFAGTLEQFQELANVGLLMVDGHGAYSENALESYLVTSTFYDEEFRAAHAAEFKEKLLIEIVEPKTYDHLVAMSSKYVKQHVLVAKGAVVFLNVCSTFRTDQMADAFIANGASTVLGWTNTVEDEDAYQTGLFAFDHLLGTNTLFPVPILQAATKPLTIPETLAYCQYAVRDGLTYNFGQSRRTLEFHADLKIKYASETIQSIVPTILNPRPNSDGSQFLVAGYFGSVPGEIIGNPGAGDVSMEILEWTPTMVRVKSVNNVTSLQARFQGLLGNIKSVAPPFFTLEGNLGPNSDLFDVFERVDVVIGNTVVASGAGTGQKLSFSARSGDRIWFKFYSSTPHVEHGQIFIKNPRGEVVGGIVPVNADFPGGQPAGNYETWGYDVP